MKSSVMLLGRRACGLSIFCKDSAEPDRFGQQTVESSEPGTVEPSLAQPRENPQLQTRTGTGAGNGIDRHKSRVPGALHNPAELFEDLLTAN